MTTVWLSKMLSSLLRFLDSSTRTIGKEYLAACCYPILIVKRPDIISLLIGVLRRSTELNGNPIHLPRTLLIFLHIVKELSAARLQRSRVALQAATPEIVQVLGQIYLDKVQSWQEALGGSDGDQEKLQQTMQSSLLAIKTLRRLLVAGYEFPNRESDVHQFWQLTYAHVGTFMNIISAQKATLPGELGLLLEKHLLQLSKLHLEMAKSHPAAFVLLPNSLDLVGSYWALIKQFGETFGSSLTSGSSKGDEAEQKSFQEKVSLSGLKLVRACIKMVFNPVQSFKYKHPQDKIEKAEAIAAVKEQLLTNAFVTEVMEVVVTKFFVFRQGELQEWEEDPEEWEQSLEGESEGWEYSVRPCAEKLFLDLALNFRDMLTQPLLNVFYTVAGKSLYNWRLCSEDRLLTNSSARQRGRLVQGLGIHSDWLGCRSPAAASRLRFVPVQHNRGRGTKTETWVQHFATSYFYPPGPMDHRQSVCRKQTSDLQDLPAPARLE